MSDAKQASDLAVLFRVGAAWRELRRGASMQAFRPMVYGEGDEALDLGQVDALDLLVFHGSARMGELAEALRVDASTATRAVNRLVDAGLAQRRRSDDDGRVMVVAITKRGTEVHPALMARRRDAIEGILADLDPHERSRARPVARGIRGRSRRVRRGNPAAEPRAS